MKKLLLLAFIIGYVGFGQEIRIGSNSTITIDANSSINIEGIKLTPSTSYVLAANNTISHSNAPIVVEGNESIAKSLGALNALMNFQGIIQINYDESELNGLDESKLIMEIEDDSNIWTSYPSALDVVGNTVTNNFTTPISFFQVTASSTETPLNTDQFEVFSGVKVYPNPARDIIHISSKSAIEYSLYNTLGQLVHKGASEAINTSEYPSGLYFLKVKELEHNTFKTIKIVKH